MRMLYIGDPHLGKMKSVLGENANTIQLKLLASLLNVARSKRCDHVVLLGDIFDSPFPTQHLMRDFIKILASATDLQFLVYAGNHDRENIDSCSLDLLSTLPDIGAATNVKFCTKPELIKFGDARIFVMPYTRQKFVPDEADFVFFHDALKGASGDNGFTLEGGLSRAMFKDKPAIGGDLHLTQKIKNVLYPGTPVQLTFGDSLPRYVWIAEYTKRKGLINKRIADWEPPWKLLDVTYDKNDPPKCDEKDCLYKLRVPANVILPARWLIDHPQVVTFTSSGKKEKSHDKLKEVASLTVEDDSTKFSNWLKDYTPLSSKAIKYATRIHEGISHGKRKLIDSDT